jgi:hypothetical protein
MIAAEKNQNPEVITTLLKAGAGLNDESTEVADIQAVVAVHDTYVVATAAARKL